MDESSEGPWSSEESEAGSENEPDTCRCCGAAARSLRTARDCCQTPVCMQCLRDVEGGRFCVSCYPG